MNKTPTPRTDAAIRGRNIEGFGQIGWIPVDFARQLEREIAELRAELAKLQAHADRVNEANDKLTMELSTLRSKRNAP